ncbi:glycosyltransferase family 2 protein [Chryseobacterium caseinilyticum]|uniref:Glycosyltransferase n=1 Tax=Chryseobacterium caseinilyticum TaxID=2771428 RepID=A0ABR8ZHR3_9FLAO|nr:glycosyltransferase [Chryseobacterium caseinilyticum]MBD8084614.1 glycosyltransferase [Chryseobacterium caseinilyticum]
MEEKYPLVTIITPSFNHARYLQNTVESVVNQTYPNIEYIIIDDGSSDNSHEIIKKIAKKYTFIKYILYDENKGHIRINEGVQLAKGDFISILSSDDWYLPTKIEMQMKLFDSLDQNYGVVYSAGFRYYEDTKEMLEPATNKMMRNGEILKNLLTEPFFIYPISPIIRKECLLRYPFSEGFRAEGEAIYFKIAMKYKFDYVQEPLVVMRDHSGNTGKDLYRMHEDNIKIRLDLFSLADFPNQYRGIAKKNLAYTYFFNGWQMIRNYKDFLNGWKNMKIGASYNSNYYFNFRFFAALILLMCNKIKLQLSVN